MEEISGGKICVSDGNTLRTAKDITVGDVNVLRDMHLEYVEEAGVFVCIEHGCAFVNINSLWCHLTRPPNEHHIMRDNETIGGPAALAAFARRVFLKPDEPIPHCFYRKSPSTPHRNEQHSKYATAPGSLSGPGVTLKAIGGITVQNGFQCEICKECFGVRLDLSTHFLKLHKCSEKSAEESASTTPTIRVQTIGRNPKRFFPVHFEQDNLKSGSEKISQVASKEALPDMGAAVSNLSRYVEGMCREGVISKDSVFDGKCEGQDEPVQDGTTDDGALPIPERMTHKKQLLLKKCQFDKHLARFGYPFMCEVRTDLVCPPQTNLELDCMVRKHLHKYACKLFPDVFATISPHVLQIVGTRAHGTQPFRMVENFDTLRRYSDFASALVCFAIRTLDQTHCSEEDGNDSIPSTAQFAINATDSNSHAAHHLVESSEQSSCVGSTVCICQDSYCDGPPIKVGAWCNGIPTLPSRLRDRVGDYLLAIKNKTIVDTCSTWKVEDMALHRLLSTVLLTDLSDFSNKLQDHFIHSFVTLSSVRDDGEQRRFKYSSELSPMLSGILFMSSATALVGIHLSETCIACQTTVILEPTLDRNPQRKRYRDGNECPSSVDFPVKDICSVRHIHFVRGCFDLSRNTSVSYIRWVLTECQRINFQSRPEVNMINCNRHHMCGIVKGNELSVNVIREACYEMMKESHSILANKVLYSMQIPESLYEAYLTTFDDFGSLQNGVSFLDLNTIPPVVKQSQYFLHRHILRTETLRNDWYEKSDSDYSGSSMKLDNSTIEKPLPGDNDLISIPGNNEWCMKRSTAMKWLQQVYELKRLILVLVHILSGGPARGTELQTYSVRNTDTALRNVYVQQGEVWLITDYGKNDSLRGFQKPIIRVIFGELSKLVLKYLTLVRNWECNVVRLLMGVPIPTYKMTQSTALFAEDNIQFSDLKMRTFVTDYIRRFNISMSFQDLRHWQVGMARRFLSPSYVQRLFGDQKSQIGDGVMEQAQLEFSVMDDQAGHTHETSEKRYAITGNTPLGITTDRTALVRHSSLKWFELIMGNSLKGGEIVSKSSFNVCNVEEREDKMKVIIAKTVDETISRLHPTENVIYDSRKVADCSREDKIRKSIARPLEMVKRAHKTLRELFKDQKALFKSQLQMDACIEILSPSCNDMVVVLPTGGGKTLLYQLPSFYQATHPNFQSPFMIVIVPLVALTYDLANRTRLLSNGRFRVITWKEKGAIFESGTGGIFFVSVEHIETEAYKCTVSKLVGEKRLSYIFVEEAHLTVLWGNFRPAMHNLRSRICPVSDNSGVSTILLSATIPPVMEKDVKVAHGIPYAPVWRTETMRTNLSYHVQNVITQRFMRLEDTLIRDTIAVLHKHVYSDEEDGGKVVNQVIVFVLTKRLVDDLADRFSESLKIRRNGDELDISILRHHSQMETKEREQTYKAWLGENSGSIRSGKKRISFVVMFATSGFGTGIDSSTVRLVIHVGGCRSLVELVQETGRGGRDGHPAKCVTLFNEEYCNRFITSSDDDIKYSEADENDEHSVLTEVRTFIGFKMWINASSVCRRQYLFHAMDGLMSPMCLVMSKNQFTWCDVCIGMFRGDIEKSTNGVHSDVSEIIEEKLQPHVQKELDQGNEESNGKLVRATVEDGAILSFIHSKAVPTVLNKRNEYVVNNDMLSAQKAIFTFREQSKRIFNKCLSCLLEKGSGNLHNADSNDHNCDDGLRCFRCFLRGHTAKSCPLFSFSVLNALSRNTSKTICFGCRLGHLRGEKLHGPDRSLFGSQSRCPFTASVRLCLMVAQDESLRHRIESSTSTSFKWPSSEYLATDNVDKCANFLMSWTCSPVISSGRLNVMEILDYVLLV